MIETQAMHRIVLTVQETLTVMQTMTNEALIPGKIRCQDAVTIFKRLKTLEDRLLAFVEKACEHDTADSTPTTDLSESL